MKRTLVCFLIFFSLICCKTSQRELQAAEKNCNSYLNTSIHDSSVYIGVSGKMSEPKKEVEYALNHIAQQIAMNNSCVIDVGLADLGNGIKYDSGFSYDNTVMEAILKRLTILSEHYFSDLTVVVAKDIYPAGEYQFTVNRKPEEKPEWLRKNPVIQGYHSAVGISGKYSDTFKSVIAADLNAAHSIALTKNSVTHLFNYNKKVIAMYTHEKKSRGSVSLSKAELHGFYVLDRWVEPDGTCYSLAIAKKD